MALSRLLRTPVRHEFMCSAGISVSIMAWDVYGACRCNLLAESYTTFQFSIVRPNRVYLLESESKIGVAYFVGIRTGKNVPNVILLQSALDGSRSLVGA